METSRTFSAFSHPYVLLKDVLRMFKSAGLCVRAEDAPE